MKSSKKEPKKKAQPKLKAGRVAFIGRPNVGKSTLLNNILGQKISVTSPRPQTTRFPIQGFLNNPKGQIIFIDTPGIFEKVKDQISKKINPLAGQEAAKADVILYVVDQTRKPGNEEAKILGIVRKINKPKILVINKIDIKSPSYMMFYGAQEEECLKAVKVSAIKGTHLNSLVDAIFELLPFGKLIIDPDSLASPALNLDAKTFVAEIIREKAFLALRDELPYTLTVKVDQLIERPNGLQYVKAVIFTVENRYKKMIIGKNGQRIKQIGMQARKELEIIANKHIFLDLRVETDQRWPEKML